jgi:hypothetical protein
MNKKEYTTPEMDIVRIAQASMIATSLTVTGYDSTSGTEPTKDEAITSEGYSASYYEFNSNAFEGGLMDE